MHGSMHRSVHGVVHGWMHDGGVLMWCYTTWMLGSGSLGRPWFGGGEVIYGLPVHENFLDFISVMNGP